MNIILGEIGLAIPDAHVKDFVQLAIAEQKDIHITQAIVVDCLRAALIQIPVANRPQVTWTFYGKEVHFNEYMASQDAWEDERMNISCRACETVLKIALQNKRAKDIVK